MRPASGDHDDDGSSSSNAEASTADAADVLVLSGSTFNHVSNPRHRYGESSSPRRSPRTGIAKKQNPTAVVSTLRRQSLMSQAVASRPGWLGPASGGYGHTLAAPTKQPRSSFSLAIRPLRRQIPHRTPALAHVRTRWRKFENVPAPNFRPDELLILVVKTVRVEVDGQIYAISTANGDPVDAYFREQEKPPKFEFDVGHPGNNAPPPQPQ
ncbi:hypothetical protein CSAL01_07732 [Colletotrichum salicis]|uniref:Uncharacterized protein n=1 Tax=Colletotrichum salicis TaxID=1209931 RepID=A0A135VA92_9PEZI|nr:hypothetical protein CSAL01_07732 [Colletotrichum salicis]